MKNGVAKKIVWACAVLVIASAFYAYVLPFLGVKKSQPDDPILCDAIVHYANNQMNGRLIKVPSRATDWKVESVQILSVKTLPGSQNKRRVKCKLRGGYKTQGDFGLEGSSYSFEQTNTFLISDKYPSGISVQYER